MFGLFQIKIYFCIKFEVFLKMRIHNTYINNTNYVNDRFYVLVSNYICVFVLLMLIALHFKLKPCNATGNYAIPNKNISAFVAFWFVLY